MLLVQTTLSAQLSGRVVDATGTPLEFVNVVLYHAVDSSMVMGSSTDREGRFFLSPVPSGEFYLMASSIGSADVYRPGIRCIPDEDQEMEDLIMDQEPLELEGVEVVSRRLPIEASPEGLVLNVQSSLLTKGSTILQLLERSPGVIIDRRDGELKLNGQAGTVVMINGKVQRIPVADLIQMLSSMDGSNVEKIELITSPSAKYDAEGGALINIQLGKSELEGTNGSLSLNAGRAWGNKIGASLNLNHADKKYNIFGNYSINHDVSFSDWRAIGSSISPPLGGFNEFDFSSENGVNSTNHNVLLGMDFDLSSTLKTGVSISHNSSKALLRTNNISQTKLPDDFNFATHIDRTGSNKWRNSSLSTFLKKRFSEKSILSADLDFVEFNLETPSKVSNRFVDEKGAPVVIDNIYYSARNRGTSTTNIKVAVFKLDYETRTLSGIELLAGLKTSFSQTGNNAAISRLVEDDWVVDDRTQSQQSIRELIGAGYIDVGYQLENGVDVGLGLRYEAWERDFNIEGLDRVQSRLFPSVFLRKEMDDANSLQLAYSHRIARPSYNDLASFLSYNGPTSVFTGNSSLQPTLTKQIKMSYHHGGKNIGLFVRHEDNPIVRYQISKNDESNVALITPQNLAFQRGIGVETNLPVQLRKVMEVNLNGTFERRRFAVTHTEEPREHAYWSYTLNGSVRYFFPKDLTMEISGWYVSNHYNGSIQVSGFGAVDLGVKKELGRFGSLQFSFEDVFQTMKIRSQIGNLTREAFESLAHVVYRSETGNNRLLRLSYHWTFGSQKIKPTLSDGPGSDEARRIRKE